MIWEGGHGKRDESHFLFLTAVTLAASPTDFAASVRLIEFRWFFRSKREGGWEFITNFVLDSSLIQGSELTGTLKTFVNKLF